MKRVCVFLAILTTALSACAPPPTQPASEPTADQSSAQPTDFQPLSGAPTLDPTLAALQLAVLPPETRTGLAELDLIIDAVLAHDSQALRDLTAYTAIGCTTADGLGGPPKCQEGEAEGTIVEVVPFLDSEGHHLRRSAYQEWQGPDVLGLLAAYRNAPEARPDPAFPAGEYALVFLEASGRTTLTIQVRDGRVVRYDYDFDPTLEGDLESLAEQVILGFSSQPVPTAVPWKAFSGPQGRFSFLYPPLMELAPGPDETSWILGDRIRIEILGPGLSWISCFDQSLGDCPFVEADQQVMINDQAVRRVEGYLGAVGGNIPQEFLAYLFPLGDQVLVFTLYALPFDAAPADVSQIWPLDGMELELFERVVETMTFPE